jgi:hypothetical protein
MKYYIDTEYLQGPQKKKMFGINYGQTKPFIDLISIGIISEDGREYYAISKDFNLEEAWNRWQYNENNVSGKNQQGKEYWIRENVLRPIFFVELFIKEKDLNKEICLEKQNKKVIESKMTYSWLKNLLDKYGKPNKQIAKEIKEFIGTKETIGNWEQVKDRMNPQFYAYYGAFDYVAFSQIFGGFEGYPESFPQYFIDLKQELDRIETVQKEKQIFFLPLKEYEKYPKQTNEHNALADARWNKQLHEFINKI